MRRICLVMIVLIICTLIIISCSEPAETPAKTTPTGMTPAVTTPATTIPSGETPQYGGTFVFNHNGGVTQIAAPADGCTSSRNTYPALESLFRCNTKEQVQPWLCESWEEASDGSSITLHLKQDLKFHDGTPFNAEAVKYNLEQVYANSVRGSSFLSKVASYDVLDEYTLQMNLKEYDCTILLRLAQGAIGQMASPTALKKEVTAENEAKLHTVGTGPFLFDSWQRDMFVRYKKNPEYRQPGKPYLDAIEVRNVSDLAVSTMAFEAGQAHAIENVDPVDALALQTKGHVIWQADVKWQHGIYPSVTAPDSPFADKRVRLALDYAINKKELCEGIGMGFYTPIGQLACPTDPWYNPDLEFREYDPEQARALLAEAGYPNGFKIKLTSDVMARKDTLTAIQTYLKEAGIETELELLEFGAAMEFPYTEWEGIWFPGFPSPGMLTGMIGRYGTEGYYVSFYRPPGWQDKWDAVVAQPDEAKRLAQIKELVKIIYDESICCFFQADSAIVMMRPELREFYFTDNFIMNYYEPENVWIAK